MCLAESIRRRDAAAKICVFSEGSPADFGALAGAAAQTAVFPIELAQRRLQAQGLAGAPVLYRGMLDCIAQIVRKEGPRALYSGLLPNYGKLVPAAAVSFYLYEVLKQRFDLE